MDPFDSNKGGNIPEADARGDAARVTVISLNMFETWEFFLNGEDIGRIEGRSKVTGLARSGQKNVLTAKNAEKGFSAPYEFYIESGTHLEMDFYRGRFLTARRIDKAVKSAPSAAKAKIWKWLYWAVLSGYCIAVFLLGREYILGAFSLSFFPFLALTISRISTHRAMVNYLNDNHPEELGEILREQYANSNWSYLLFPKDACDDPEYLELREKYNKVFWAQILLACTMLASYFYFRSAFTG